MKKYNIYEVRTTETPIQGVMFRGRIRKFCLGKRIDALVENATDIEGAVRFAVVGDGRSSEIADYVRTIAADATVELVMEAVPNPVLSKLKVNDETRYNL